MGDLSWGVVVALLIGWAVMAYEFWGLPRRARRVIVNFADLEAPAIEGLLWTRRGRWIVLRDCVLLVPRREPSRIDGEVIIDRSSVLFVQIVADVSRSGGLRHG